MISRRLRFNSSFSIADDRPTPVAQPTILWYICARNRTWQHLVLRGEVQAGVQREGALRGA